MTHRVLFAIAGLFMATRAWAQGTGQVRGRVTDETGGALPGATVELHSTAGAPVSTVTSRAGEYAFERVRPGRYQLSFSLINFASHTQRNLNVQTGTTQVNVVLHLSLSADVTVTGKRTFANLADVENPAENLVGIAQSASQGAITARQLDERPLMRQGEALETVPGVIVTQHSGEGKPISIFRADSTSITGPTSRASWRECR